jgi:plastocyanin
VHDPGGRPVEDAVIALFVDPEATPAASATSSPEATGVEPPRAVMDQKHHQFVPHVLPVRVDTDVVFPNSDQIRHHVYSFSEAKTFELRLYSGVPAEPVQFDRAGEVVLGCNIHDQMLGYIHVLETPHFAATGSDGRAVLADVPAGRHRLELWHPRSAPGREPAPRAIDVGRDSAVTLEIEVLARARPEEHGEAPSPLAEKFRRHRKP